ncbi:hypothetical protein BKA69DRAFT_1121635 [Paraphysoderma sedebokerense]|nr:hypothetical protein BKA69DRAFT_1121635 [Paraphysoderma sedebokerense]
MSTTQPAEIIFMILHSLSLFLSLTLAVILITLKKQPLLSTLCLVTSVLSFTILTGLAISHNIPPQPTQLDSQVNQLNSGFIVPLDFCYVQGLFINYLCLACFHLTTAISITIWCMTAKWSSKRIRKMEYYSVLASIIFPALITALMGLAAGESAHRGVDAQVWYCNFMRPRLAKWIGYLGVAIVLSVVTLGYSISAFINIVQTRRQSLNIYSHTAITRSSLFRLAAFIAICGFVSLFTNIPYLVESLHETDQPGSPTIRRGGVNLVSNSNHAPGLREFTTCLLGIALATVFGSSKELWADLKRWWTKQTTDDTDQPGSPTLELNNYEKNNKVQDLEANAGKPLSKKESIVDFYEFLKGPSA